MEIDDWHTWHDEYDEPGSELADRLRTVSYGREFPFDPGHDDAAWAKNRRAHFVITAK
mgnify:CR=1 FL=1